MAEGGCLGRWPVVGIEGRDSTGGSGFTVARQRVPALRFRSVDRSLAQESGSGRGNCRPLCRRPRGGLRKPDGSRTFSRRVSGTLAKFGLELHTEKTRLIEFGK